MPHDPLLQLNTALAGRYAIERELARGGMATIYLASDLRHSRRVVLKVLHRERGSAIGADRFAREIGTAARLNHPHIVALYDSGEVADSLFFVMPYIEGESLRERLDRDGPFAIEAALAVTRQAAAALDYAHKRQVIHRDIKPENILLHEGEAMVADFGIALALGGTQAERLTTTGLAVGTPHYMSPEQASGETHLDARSDIYSLACVLYELLTGQPPHAGGSAQAVIARRFIEPAPSVRVRRADVPADVDAAIMRALAPDPADRFATCPDFIEALATRPAAASATAPELPSVAVLPFRNLSADPANEFFADGMTEDVITQLSKIRSLKVISRSSAMRFKSREQGLRAIGAMLGVATLLEGSVRRAGDQVRIVAQLVDASTDRHLWAETYDRQMHDIFAIQTDVALKIAEALTAELLPQERARIVRQQPTSLEAYAAFTQGRQSYGRYTEDSILQGIALFRKAIAIDPGFALAHVGLGLAYIEIAMGQGGGSIQPDLAYRLGRDAVMTALELDDESGEAHAVLALHRLAHDFDWVGAEAEFKKALELSPGSADIYDHYGWLCAALERYDEALTLVRRAQELDPLMHRSDVASTLVRAGRYAEATFAAEQAVAMEPGYARGLSTLGWAQLRGGDPARGIASLEQAARLDPGNTFYQSQLGQAYGECGRSADARRVLADLEALARVRYVSPYHMAYVHTGLGEADRAIDYLERAFDERAGAIYGIKGSFLFTSLRGHPRFQRLLGRMHLA